MALARAYGYKLGIWNDVESGNDYVAHIYAIDYQGKPVDVTGVWSSEEEMAEEVHGIWGTYSNEYTFDELSGESAVKAINDDIMTYKWNEKFIKEIIDYVLAHPEIYGPKATKRIDIDER